MREIWNKQKPLFLWLLADLGLLAAFWFCRGRRDWMNALADRVTTPIKLALGRLCAWVDFSVMELLCILLVLGASGYLLWAVLALIRARGRRWCCLVRFGLGAVCTGLTIYVGFCLLWGVNYYTDSFQDRSGLRARPGTVEELGQLTAYFAEKTAETADVLRDAQGRFAVPRAEILAESVRVYDAVERRFPFLALEDTGAKGIHFSRVMSALDFTGVYCPFTGESNVNLDSPACMLPATVAHELAHQRAVASEQECNFLGILAATTSGDPAYVYSGWLTGYLYLSNALYRVDRERWTQIRAALPKEVRIDLADNSTYWAAFADQVTQRVSNSVYDRFLKGYGEELGIQSYGTVVDLLLSDYGEAAAEWAKEAEKG